MELVLNERMSEYRLVATVITVSGDRIPLYQDGNGRIYRECDDGWIDVTNHWRDL